MTRLPAMLSEWKRAISAELKRSFMREDRYRLHNCRLLEVECQLPNDDDDDDDDEVHLQMFILISVGRN